MRGCSAGLPLSSARTVDSCVRSASTSDASEGPFCNPWERADRSVDRSDNRSASRLSSQILLEHDELEVRTLRLAKTGIPRGGLGLTGAAVTAPLIPGNQALTHRHHAHARNLRSAGAPRRLGVLEHQPAQSAVLPARPDCQHTDVAGRLAI